MTFLNLILLVHLSTTTTQAHAEEAETYQINTTNNRFDDQIVHKHDLATELGMREPDAVFGQPRSFNSEELNTMQLDPLKDDSEEPIKPAKK